MKRFGCRIFEKVFFKENQSPKVFPCDKKRMVHEAAAIMSENEE
jgi:hypothetical protein